MEKTPRGTSVGVDDPYAFADDCDYLTGDGRCRYAFEYADHDLEFARERASADYVCPVVDPETDEGWADCPHFRSRSHTRECTRCGLAEKRLAHDDDRPLLEEHHLSYADTGETLSHEITIYLCRWCHAKVHTSWARVTDDVPIDPAAIAEREARRSREHRELGFESAANRDDE